MVDRIDAAVADILENGQDVTIGTQRYTAASIDKLTNLRDYYARIALSAGRGGILDRARAAIPHRGCR